MRLAMMWTFAQAFEIPKILDIMDAYKSKGYKGVIYNELRESIEPSLEILDEKEMTYEIIDLDNPGYQEDLLNTVVETQMIPDDVDFLVFLGRTPENLRFIDKRIQMIILNSDEILTEDEIYEKTRPDSLIIGFRVGKRWEPIDAVVYAAEMKTGSLEKRLGTEMTEADRQEIADELHVFFMNKDKTPLRWMHLEWTFKKMGVYQFEKYEKEIDGKVEDIVVVTKVKQKAKYYCEIEETF